jgi:hypothetical protein
MVVLWLRVGTADAELDVEELAGFDEDVEDDETGSNELLELEDDNTEFA